MNALRYLPYSEDLGGYATPLSVKVVPNFNKYWRLYVIGDPHIEHRFTSVSQLYDYINFIADDPHSVVIIVGDLVDATLPDNKFFDATQLSDDTLLSLDRYLNQVLEKIEEVFEPLKNRDNVIVISGNHDMRFKYVNFSELVCGVMGWKYGWYSSLIAVEVLRDGGKDKRIRTIFAHHGSGGGMYPGGKLNRMQTQLPNVANANFYVQGHVHDSLSRVITIEEIEASDEPKIRISPRTFLSAPGWLRGRPFYIQRKGTARTDHRVVAAQVEEQEEGIFDVRLVEWKPGDIPLPYLDQYIESFKKDKSASKKNGSKVKKKSKASK